MPRHKKVRTGFFEEITIFLGISLGEQICPVFSLQNEPDDRFEPVEAVGFKRLQLASDFSLPVDQGVFLGNILGLADLLGQAHVEQKVCLFLADRQVGFELGHGSFLAVCRCRAFLLKLADHEVGDGCPQNDLADLASNLRGDGLLAHIFLGASRHALGASEVVVSLLRLGGDEAAALAAVEETAIEEGLERGRLGLALFFHDNLRLVKEALGNDRLVLAFERLAVGKHDAVEEGVAKHLLVVGHGKFLAGVGEQADLAHACADFVQGVVARRIKLEGFADEWSFGRVNDDGTLVPVVEVADGWLARPNAVPELLPDAAFDVL